MAFVTGHAAERYVERIAPFLTPAQARRETLRSAAAIDQAAAFGARIVRLANGARLCLEGDTVTTIKLPDVRQPKSRAMMKRFRHARR